MEKKSSKERILEAALTLFAERGFDGVGVDLIAEHAGMKGPSLYKHFKGKQEIFEGILNRIEEYYEENFGSEAKPGRIPGSLEELVEISLGRIRFTMHDEMVQKTRRLLTMEQFRNPQVAMLATRHYLDGMENLYAGILGAMMEQKLIREEDPRQLAVEFVSPVTLMIHTYDRQPEREAELLERMEKHFSHFIKVYGV